jgi:hypothetical protein
MADLPLLFHDTARRLLIAKKLDAQLTVLHNNRGMGMRYSWLPFLVRPHCPN